MRAACTARRRSNEQSSVFAGLLNGTQIGQIGRAPSPALSTSAAQESLATASRTCPLTFLSAEAAFVVGVHVEIAAQPAVGPERDAEHVGGGARGTGTVCRGAASEHGDEQESGSAHGTSGRMGGSHTSGLRIATDRVTDGVVSPAVVEAGPPTGSRLGGFTDGSTGRVGWHGACR